jgi:hypothetical protein
LTWKDVFDGSKVDNGFTDDILKVVLQTKYKFFSCRNGDIVFVSHTEKTWYSTGLTIESEELTIEKGNTN